MKKPAKQELDLLGVISTIQSRLIALDKKIDSLLERSAPQTITVKPTLPPAPPAPSKTRPMYTAICADCKKECSIPFKPSGDRPVYCKDCFSRRKVISLSRIGQEDKPKEVAPDPIAITRPIETKKPAVKKKVAAKKVVIKKKTIVKKK